MFQGLGEWLEKSARSTEPPASTGSAERVELPKREKPRKEYRRECAYCGTIFTAHSPQPHGTLWQNARPLMVDKVGTDKLCKSGQEEGATMDITKAIAAIEAAMKSLDAIERALQNNDSK